MAAQSSRKRVPEAPVIPDRLYFKIGDVARICGVETYVLRFWETQFPQLKPNKSGTGQRLYRKREVELALEIKRLVHGEGYTLSGARHVLGQARRADAPPAPATAATPAPKPVSAPRNDKLAATIGHARAELREIISLLEASQPAAPRRKARMASMPHASGVLFPS